MPTVAVGAALLGRLRRGRSPYRARATSESTAPEAEPSLTTPKSPAGVRAGWRLIRWEKNRGLEARPLTQTARDEESEAE
ncbi:hypothetical protein [Streptomyces peucetius]